MIRAVALAAIFALCAAAAAADAIPGPPIGPARDRAGAYCELPGDGASGNAVAFAAGVAIVAITARRRA